MTNKLKGELLAIEIDRDELAIRIAEKAMGVKPPETMTARAALDQLNALTEPGMPPLGDGFRAAAAAAVAYFHQCITNGMRGQ